MKTTIHLPNGVEHSGKTVETIIRRVWGRSAFFQRSADPNSPEVGMVLRTTDQQSVYAVCANVLWIYGAPVPAYEGE
jgi:hypothetical protein